MDFLQSKIWREFQASVGRKIFEVENISIIEHQLPIVGKYFYTPRWPECHPERSEGSRDSSATSQDDKLYSSTMLGMIKIIDLAKKEKIGWIRIEPESESALNAIKNLLGHGVSKLVKAPHDMQPKELFVIDISKSEEELLAQMKQKTRYNINLAKKRGVSLRISNRYEAMNDKDIEEFLRLVKITAERDGITSHPENYYRQMIKMIPAENLQLYLAEFEGKIIVANIMIFFEDTAIYLHGASDNEFRNVMAPYLLQWKQIQDAKTKGCRRYDFGGISTNYESNTNIRITNKWAGITRFKLGFSPNTEPTKFPGCYDIVIKSTKYFLYRTIQKIKSIL